MDKIVLSGCQLLGGYSGLFLFVENKYKEYHNVEKWENINILQGN
jgi:hypothetical protein